MVEVRRHYLPPTQLIPNSTQPLLHYPGLLSQSDRQPGQIHQIFDKNDWKTQWIFRYGPTQASHYHSQIHECMAVLSGTATIRFGVGDTDEDLEKSTWGGAKEAGGVEIAAAAGDVFVIPAGVAHKTYDTSPAAPFSLLTPGRGRGIEAEDPKRALDQVKLSGFTMMGAYPKNCGNWDFSVGGEDTCEFDRVWAVAKPDKDPILGSASEGLCGLWEVLPLSSRGTQHSKL